MAGRLQLARTRAARARCEEQAESSGRDVRCQFDSGHLGAHRYMDGTDYVVWGSVGVIAASLVRVGSNPDRPNPALSRTARRGLSIPVPGRIVWQVVSGHFAQRRDTD